MNIALWLICTFHCTTYITHQMIMAYVIIILLICYIHHVKYN